MKWYKKLALKNFSDLVVENNGKVYLERWFLFPRNPFFNIYLHRFTNSDLATYHDHPWFSMAYVLEGEFIEHKPNMHPRYCREGSFYFRSPWTKHWLEVEEAPTWTLFFTGPVMKRWGFIENGKWKHHKTFLEKRKETVRKS